MGWVAYAGATVRMPLPGRWGAFVGLVEPVDAVIGLLDQSDE
ncbi:hypothetical protein ACSDR0_06770 [Streptosporangium sp. G11]